MRDVKSRCRLPAIPPKERVKTIDDELLQPRGRRLSLYIRVAHYIRNASLLRINQVHELLPDLRISLHVGVTLGDVEVHMPLAHDRGRINSLPRLQIAQIVKKESVFLRSGGESNKIIVRVSRWLQQIATGES